MKILKVKMVKLAFMTMFLPVTVVMADASSAKFQCAGSESSELVSLEQVQSSYSKLKGMRSAFLQVSYLASLDEQEESAGVLFYQAPGKMRWQYERPEKQRFIINQKDVWFYQELDKQVVVDSLDSVVLSDLPLTFLMGIGTLGEQFRVERQCRASSGVLLELVAREKEKAGQLDRLVLLLEASRYLPIGARIVDLAGNITTILFEKPKYDPQLDKELFAPDWPDYIDIIDRRR